MADSAVPVADVSGTCNVGTADTQDGPRTLRVATWNLEWAKRARVRTQQTEVIAATAADVWVLTEARPSALPGGLESAVSADIPTAASNGRLAGDAGCFAVVGAPVLKPV